jgi:capsular polysaccharide biosynthesis protein
MEEEFIDLRSILKVIGKWRKVIIGGTLLAVLTAALLSFFVLPPVYEAKALLLVTLATDKQQTAQQSGEGVEGVVEPLTRIPVLTINTYLGQLQSEELMRRVISRLKLDPAVYTPKSLAQMVNASVQKDSNLIELTVQNSDPKLAADIANAVCKEFLELLSQKNQEQMGRSVDLLQKQRQQTEKELEKAIQELKKFQSQPRGVAVLEEEFKLKASNLANYKSQMDSLNVEIQQLQAGVDLLESELANTSPVIEVQRLDPVSGKVLEGKDSNPVYVDLSEKLADKKAALAEKEAQLAAIGSLTSGLTADIDKLNAELNEKKAQQDRLQAEVDRLKETLNTLSKKITETQIAKSLDIGRTTVVVVSDAATPTQPVKPRKALNTAVAGVLGLMLFTGLAFLLEHLDYTIKTPDDVAQHLELPVIGTIPLATRKTTESSYGS